MTTKIFLLSAFFLPLMFLFCNPIYGINPGNGDPDPLPIDGTEVKLDTNDSSDIMHIWSSKAKTLLNGFEEITAEDRCSELGGEVFAACVRFWPGGFPSQANSQSWGNAVDSCFSDGQDAERQCRGGK